MYDYWESGAHYFRTAGAQLFQCPYDPFLYDPEWEEGQAPHEIDRAQFGRISITNTDSEAIALLSIV